MIVAIADIVAQIMWGAAISNIIFSGIIGLIN